MENKEPTRLKGLSEEPTLFKLKGKNYLSTARKSFSDTFLYCVNVETGELAQIPMDAAVEESDFQFVKRASIGV